MGDDEFQVGWFLYVTDSTLNPIVGIVVTTSPIFSLYKRVVFPALSSPRINILISFFDHSIPDNQDTLAPILNCVLSATKCLLPLVPLFVSKYVKASFFVKSSIRQRNSIAVDYS